MPLNNGNGYDEETTRRLLAGVAEMQGRAQAPIQAVPLGIEQLNAALSAAGVPMQDRANASEAALRGKNDTRGFYDLGGPDHFKIRELRRDVGRDNWIPFTGAADRKPFADKVAEYQQLLKEGNGSGMGGPQMSANELANAQLRGKYAREDMELRERLQNRESDRENTILTAMGNTATQSQGNVLQHQLGGEQLAQKATQDLAGNKLTESGQDIQRDLGNDANQINRLKTVNTFNVQLKELDLKQIELDDKRANQVGGLTFQEKQLDAQIKNQKAQLLQQKAELAQQDKQFKAKLAVDKVFGEEELKIRQGELTVRELVAKNTHSDAEAQLVLDTLRTKGLLDKENRALDQDAAQFMERHALALDDLKMNKEQGGRTLDISAWDSQMPVEGHNPATDAIMQALVGINLDPLGRFTRPRGPAEKSILGLFDTPTTRQRADDKAGFQQIMERKAEWEKRNGRPMNPSELSALTRVITERTSGRESLQDAPSTLLQLMQTYGGR